MHLDPVPEPASNGGKDPVEGVLTRLPALLEDTGFTGFAPEWDRRRPEDGRVRR
jgi:hypothetical protein